MKRDESFTEVILRMVRKKEGGNLLEYFSSITSDEEFAATLVQLIVLYAGYRM